MKAVGLYKYLPIEHEESLVEVNVERPVPHQKDLLVKIEAISINPVDVKVRAPKDKQEDTPKILGWDASGIVEEVGPDCTLFKPGDTVYYSGSITRPGTYSEYHLVDERIVGSKPKSLTFAESAALPLTAITAWEGLFDRLGIDLNKKNENEQKSILIIGGAGGVGSVAVQLAKLAGLKVIATASRKESKQWVQELGADEVINHHQSFLPQIQEIGLDHVDYIFCLNNTDQHWDNMGEAIVPQGRICSIVENNEPLDLNVLKSKSVTFVWEFMFTRSMYQTKDLVKQHDLLTKLSQLIDEDKVRTTLTECFSPLNAVNLRKAHNLVETGRMIGKVVVKNG
ncbi:zinc-binding alcohol dehydrogenase family protein [Gracilibacillus caseinilyticus]|uniref:Zinc-type alcohol dehydrogenase-like protein n=1 Tax=Gracilibacillus caseinilyticus TaxID=2932256 RepID=A0ABY4F0V1_9BACI|nr:zinc-binding alcohol dehydrogenase family protein [Gracilibacillus caseinilyticus]UOQ50302.1 zinc-binding alcohol dehydrogenase family protein [Gracilibacillus caseinilyticus]